MAALHQSLDDGERIDLVPNVEFQLRRAGALVDEASKAVLASRHDKRESVDGTQIDSVIGKSMPVAMLERAWWTDQKEFFDGDLFQQEVAAILNSVENADVKVTLG